MIKARECATGCGSRSEYGWAFCQKCGDAWDASPELAEYRAKHRDTEHWVQQSQRLMNAFIQRLTSERSAP